MSVSGLSYRRDPESGALVLAPGQLQVDLDYRVRELERQVASLAVRVAALEEGK